MHCLFSCQLTSIITALPSSLRHIHLCHNAIYFQLLGSFFWWEKGGSRSSQHNNTYVNTHAAILRQRRRWWKRRWRRRRQRGIRDCVECHCSFYWCCGMQGRPDLWCVCVRSRHVYCCHLRLLKEAKTKKKKKKKKKYR